MNIPVISTVANREYRELGNIKIYYQKLFSFRRGMIFHAVTPPFPSRRQWDSLVAIKPHHSTEDVNKPDMLLLKLALNFRATIISFSIFTNVI